MVQQTEPFGIFRGAKHGKPEKSRAAPQRIHEHSHGGNDMRTYATIPLFFVLAMLVSGCISINHTMLDTGQRHAPVPGPEVQVFFESDDLPEHTRVALLYGKTFENITTESKLINRLRAAAGELGANGVVLLGRTDLGGEIRVSGDALIGYGESGRRGQALAIRVH